MTTEYLQELNPAPATADVPVAGNQPLVFMNYLSKGEEGLSTGDAYAASFLDHLLQAEGGFSSDEIFFASRIKAGENFMEALIQAARNARVMLALMGENWEEAIASGRHLWTARELHEAMRTDAVVMPVWLGNLAHTPRRQFDISIPAGSLGLQEGLAFTLDTTGFRVGAPFSYRPERRVADARRIATAIRRLL